MWVLSLAYGQGYPGCTCSLREQASKALHHIHHTPASGRGVWGLSLAYGQGYRGVD